jgi:hypothetical protein
MSSIDGPGSLRALERRAVLVQSAIAIVLCMIVLFIVVSALWESRQPRIASISLTDVQAVGETNLCPGEALRIRYGVRIAGAGVLDSDATIWKLEPPYTIVSSFPQRIVVDGAVDQQVEEVWIIPDEYVNPRTGLSEPLPPGEYRRNISLSSVDRDRVSAIGSVLFVIAADC